MAEYIDKQALIDGMVKVDGRKWSTKTLGEVLDAIGSIEIVRCKDCKHSRPSNLFNISWAECNFHGRLVVKDDFCSWGERREDGKTD